MPFVLQMPSSAKEKKKNRDPIMSLHVVVLSVIINFVDFFK